MQVQAANRTLIYGADLSTVTDWLTVYAVCFYLPGLQGYLLLVVARTPVLIRSLVLRYPHTMYLHSTYKDNPRR